MNTKRFCFMPPQSQNPSYGPGYSEIDIIAVPALFSVDPVGDSPSHTWPVQQAHSHGSQR